MLLKVFTFIHCFTMKTHLLGFKLFLHILKPLCVPKLSYKQYPHNKRDHNVISRIQLNDLARPLHRTPKEKKT